MAEEEVFTRVESLMREWRLEEATRLLEERLARPAPPERIHHDLSVLYSQQGLFDPALAAIELALARDPANRAVWHHYLAIQKNNPSQPTDAAWKSMHLRFGDTLRERFDARHLAVARARDPEARLRIGYLGPDTHNATERFVHPVLERFDRARFEVFAYWNHDRALANAGAYPHAAHRSIEGLGTDAIVAQVLADRIDILVDIAGHGAGNALPALALRPAPIQVTWLDYLATTGLETVDYRVTDAIADPPGAEARHVERLARLPVPQWCYRPPREAPAPGTGARSGSDVVFGAISVPLKLSAPLLEMWARLLARDPRSRLRFLGIPEGRARARIESFFTRAGIGADRLEIVGRLPLRDFFAALSAIDVVLDTYPFSGATATLDALWQGASVASLAGRLSHSRSGASILAALGKADWVASDEEGYLAIAARLASECRAPGFDRAAIRDALARSALCDAGRFVRALESAYRDAWRAWLHETQSIDAARAHVNARADVLLSGASSARCRDLVDTLPSHKVTGQVFWSEFRGTQDESADRVVLGEIAEVVVAGGALKGGQPWIALTTQELAAAAARISLPANALVDRDAVASLGADALPHGSLLAAGRGHVGGVRAEVAGEAVHASLWVPHRMRECVVLRGTILLVKRAALASSPFPDAADFARSVSIYTFNLARAGARLGIVAALALPEGRAPGAAEEFEAERELAEATGTRDVPQAAVAASALRAVVPAAAWPAFLRRAERFCDRYPAHGEADIPCA